MIDYRAVLAGVDGYWWSVMSSFNQHLPLSTITTLDNFFVDKESFDLRLFFFELRPSAFYQIDLIECAWFHSGRREYVKNFPREYNKMISFAESLTLQTILRYLWVNWI